MHVVCVLWGTKYTPEHVYKLRNMVTRNSKYLHEFVCFTDNPDQFDGTIKTVKLPENDLKGWWNKLWLFSHEAALEAGYHNQPVMFFDLDLVILGDLEPIMRLPMHDNQLYGIGEWKYPAINSSVLFWKGCHSIWSDFNPKVMGKLHSDQEWIAFHKPDLHHFPRGWVQAYKYHCKDGVPEGCKIVTFQGKPKMEEVDADFIRDHWR